MTPSFPNTPSPAWYRAGSWQTASTNKNGIYYVGDSVTIYLTDDDGTVQTGTPNPLSQDVTYEVRDFFGDLVSSGSVSSGAASFTVNEPAGGWDPGWYRVYLTGASYDADFDFSSGVTNFAIFRDDSNFSPITLGDVGGHHAIPGGVPPGDPYLTVDNLMYGVCGLGISRMGISDPTQGSGGYEWAHVPNDIEQTKNYWTDNGLPDPVRPREIPLTVYGSQGIDQLVFNGDPAGLYGVFYPFSQTLDGDNLYLKTSAGTAASTDKIEVFYPNVGTLVETWDNLDSATEAETTINASSVYIRFYKYQATRVAYSGPTAIGQIGRDSLIQLASDFYALGVTWFEGPWNEPFPAQETGHAMKLFSEAIKQGEPNALVMGPCPVSLTAGSWSEYDAGGGFDAVDGISVHAYNSSVNGDLNLGRNQLQAFFDMLESYGQESKPVWQTESTPEGNYIDFGIYHLRRNKKLIMYWLLWEQFGVPKERNAPWYGSFQSYWGVPNWLSNWDAALQPNSVLGRVFSEEIWGKTFTEALDFGTPGNNIFIGSLYTGATDQVVVLMAASFMEDASVGLTTSGAGTHFTVVDGFGVESTLTSFQGLLTVPLTDLPTYVRVPLGESVSVVRCNGWEISAIGTPLQTTTVTREIDGTPYTELADGLFMSDYGSGTGIVPPGAGVDPSTYVVPPATVTLEWDHDETVNRVFVWCGPCWQACGVLMEFEIETYDGVSWTSRETVSKDTPPYFLFGSGQTDVGCFMETYWDEQWIFDVQLSEDVVCSGVRINVTESSYGGEPLAAPDFGQGLPEQGFRIEEIGLFFDQSVPPPTPPVTTTPGSGGSEKSLNRRFRHTNVPPARKKDKSSYVVLRGK